MRRRRSIIGSKKTGTPEIIKLEKNLNNYLARLMVRNSNLGRFAFFVDILSGMRTIECSTTPTFSMAVENGHYVMRYSPTMVEQLDELGAGIVIAHELGHAALSHTARMLQARDIYKEDRDKLIKISAVMHVAADYALNSWLIDQFKIFTLRELKCSVGTPLEEPTEDQKFEGEPMGEYAGIHPSDAGLPPLKSMEWYTQELLKRAGGDAPMLKPPTNGNGSSEDEKYPGKGSPVNSPDGSGESEEGEGKPTSVSKALEAITAEQLQELLGGSGLSEEHILSELDEAIGDSDKSIEEITEALNRKFKRAMVTASNNLGEKSRGTVGGNIKAWVEELTKDPEINWRDVLKRYTTSANPNLRKRSMSRPKRNYTRIKGFRTSPFPGRIKNPTYSIVFAIDTSGSVSNGEIQEIFTELEGIIRSNPGLEVTVVECDTRIVKIYEMSKSSEIDRDLRGRGGTSFDPVFAWVRGDKVWYDDRAKTVRPPRSVDLLIYATDGECTLPPPQLRIPESKVLWLLSSRGRIPSDNWGYFDRPTEIYGTTSYGNFIHLKNV
jgi:predicted metal-dependent peptidase